MRQPFLTTANLAESSNVTAEVEWQGGNGWLIVSNLLLTGTPTLTMSVKSEDFPGAPSSISASGIYAFYAPKGAILYLEISTGAGEQISFGNIYLLGDK